MERFGGFIERIGLAMAGNKNPWGSGSKGDGDGDGGKAPAGSDSPGGAGSGKGKPPGPRNPWLPGGGDSEPRRSANIEDIFKHRGPEGPRRGGGSGGGSGFRMPNGPGAEKWLPRIGIALAVVALLISMLHQVGPREQGIVTTFGKYSSTISPGISFTLPWPVQNVEIYDVSSIRRENIPDSGDEKLMLTGDQNLVDVSYIIRWNISDLKLYRFQLTKPVETVTEVAEAAMRASVAEMELDRVMSGAGRAEIEQRVQDRMQSILDGYKAGIIVQGVEIEKTDPPGRVIDAFKAVSAAQQEAETEINRSRAWAQQLLAKAEGDAAAFDKVYEEYRQAPEVTRRRLYYETMERVLKDTDKTVVETDGMTSYLPLPEIKRRAAPAAAAAATGGQ